MRHSPVDPRCCSEDTVKEAQICRWHDINTVYGAYHREALPLERLTPLSSPFRLESRLVLPSPTMGECDPPSCQS